MSKETERLEDEIAILQHQAGDRDALARLIARQQRPLYVYIRSVLGDAGAAWDVSQEVWTAVVKALRRPRHIRCFSAWLYRVAHNKCVSYLRRKGRAGDLEDSAAESLADEGESIPDAICESEGARRPRCARAAAAGPARGADALLSRRHVGPQHCRGARRARRHRAVAPSSREGEAQEPSVRERVRQWIRKRGNSCETPSSAARNCRPTWASASGGR